MQILQQQKGNGKKVKRNMGFTCIDGSLYEKPDTFKKKLRAVLRCGYCAVEELALALTLLQVQ